MQIPFFCQKLYQNFIAGNYLVEIKIYLIVNTSDDFFSECNMI